MDFSWRSMSEFKVFMAEARRMAEASAGMSHFIERETVRHTALAHL
jgi:hypothetical protein